ncbi:MAG: sugar phosphate nucleotidyltransferase [Solirubrobacteraceae bacterium]
MGEDVPGTHRVANRPIVCHVLDGLAAAGVENRVVVAPPGMAREIRNSVELDGACPGTVAYIEQDPDSGLAGALLAARELVGDDPCVVHFADGLVDQELGPAVRLLERDAPDLLLLLHRTADAQYRLGPVAKRQLGISELTGSKTYLGLAGVCLFGPGVLRRACAGLNPDPELDFHAIAEQLAGGGWRLQAAFVRAWRRYCGKPMDLLELNRIVLDQQMPDGHDFDGDGNRIEGRVIIHPTAVVSSSIILGPSIIGPGARVVDSYIGPYTSIGRQAVIECAEVERSIISDGARIKHVSGRIEASTVGPRASIFRDFGLPRAMRLHVGEGVEVALN